MRASVALLCLMMLLSGCVGGGRERPPETVGEVNLERYHGWHACRCSFSVTACAPKRTTS